MMLENTLVNEIDIFPVTITMYRNEKYLSMNSKLMELIDQEETTGPQGIKNTSGQSLHPFQTLNTHLHEKEEYSFFYDWVNACLENYYHTYRLNTEGLRVNLSWANVSPKMNEHRPHVHQIHGSLVFITAHQTLLQLILIHLYRILDMVLLFKVKVNWLKMYGSVPLTLEH